MRVHTDEGMNNYTMIYYAVAQVRKVAKVRKGIHVHAKFYTDIYFYVVLTIII